MRRWSARLGLVLFVPFIGIAYLALKVLGCVCKCVSDCAQAMIEVAELPAAGKGGGGDAGERK